MAENSRMNEGTKRPARLTVPSGLRDGPDLASGLSWHNFRLRF
jgi:hypothetical protein